MSRTQAERSAATQEALTAAARKLWGARGYAAVGTPEIADAAGVTRGAMYHQYADKAAVFHAVIEAVEAEVMERLTASVVAAAPSSPTDAIRIAARSWLEIAIEPEIRQLILLDAPTVLGSNAFRKISQRYALGMTQQLLTAAIDAGELRPMPVVALATVLLAAIDEAAIYAAEADDPATALAEVEPIITTLLDGLTT